MHPIVVLQGALIAALRNDPALVALAGADGVFDAPPRDRAAPYLVIARHDVIQRDADAAAGQEHRVLIHCWSDQPSRKQALLMAERVVAAIEGLAPTGLTVTSAAHVRTDTAVDGKTGLARAAVTLRLLSEA